MQRSGRPVSGFRVRAELRVFGGGGFEGFISRPLGYALMRSPPLGFIFIVGQTKDQLNPLIVSLY
jgi:hypothetical protein